MRKGAGESVGYPQVIHKVSWTVVSYAQLVHKHIHKPCG